ncbi:hypothetical protein HK102_000537 [Quaeritorhiza haematococci]|nr:hypothetical protein HK102_000537 [Quaeritorhiza haematococci]
MEELIAFVRANFPPHTIPTVLRILRLQTRPKPAPLLPPELVRLISEYCDRDEVLALRRVCKGWCAASQGLRVKADTIFSRICDQGSVWVDTLEVGPGVNFQCFELDKFSNLHKLVLEGVASTNCLHSLFDLEHLKELVVNTGPDGEYEFEETWADWVDRDRACAFFSTLHSVDFGRTSWIPGQPGGSPVLHDLAHPELRKINFGARLTVVDRFFSTTTFESLAVVEVWSSERFVLRTLADRCTGIRALCWRNYDTLDPGAIEYFLRRRGPQLIALELDFDGSQEQRTRIGEAIVRNCRSLELVGRMTINARVADFELKHLQYMRALSIDGDVNEVVDSLRTLGDRRSKWEKAKRRIDKSLRTNRDMIAKVIEEMEAVAAKMADAVWGSNGSKGSKVEIAAGLEPVNGSFGGFRVVDPFGGLLGFDGAKEQAEQTVFGFSDDVNLLLNFVVNGGSGAANGAVSLPPLHLDEPLYPHKTDATNFLTPIPNAGPSVNVHIRPRTADQTQQRKPAKRLFDYDHQQKRA